MTQLRTQLRVAKAVFFENPRRHVINIDLPIAVAIDYISVSFDGESPNELVGACNRQFRNTRYDRSFASPPTAQPAIGCIAAGKFGGGLFDCGEL